MNRQPLLPSILLLAGVCAWIISTGHAFAGDVGPALWYGIAALALVLVGEGRRREHLLRSIHDALRRPHIDRRRVASPATMPSNQEED